MAAVLAVCGFLWSILVCVCSCMWSMRQQYAPCHVVQLEAVCRWCSRCLARYLTPFKAEWFPSDPSESKIICGR